MTRRTKDTNYMYTHMKYILYLVCQHNEYNIVIKIEKSFYVWEKIQDMYIEYIYIYIVL
jgi:hypothetical protein